jgi:outer membrane lipoprotein-sorting protein
MLTRNPLSFCITLSILLLLSGFTSYAALQEKQDKKKDSEELKKKDTGKVASPKDIEKQKQAEAKLSPAEAVAELIIYAYGSRLNLEPARANIQEEGTIRLATEQGDITGNYLLRQSKREKSWLDLLRVDLDLSTPEEAQKQGALKSVKYIIGYNGASVWSAQNDKYVNPRPDAEAAFKAQLTHDYAALLRYKEDGSKLELKKPETVVGVECNVLELTLPDGTKTTYWVSSKTYRILHAEYSVALAADQPPVKYRISYFYTPLRVVQNTLVPGRRVMYQDGKFVQEITINQFTYGTKFDAEIFQHLP